MFVITLLFMLSLLSIVRHRHATERHNVNGIDRPGSLDASQEIEEGPSYDITNWVQQLHLQQCVFVEIGEGFCALFVESTSIPAGSKVMKDRGGGEFFLGLCDCGTLRTWNLCTSELMSQRKSDCVFTEATAKANTSARVHRRLCDVTLLSRNASMCNCSVRTGLAGQQLYKTEGFPTCFANPLPDSLCSPRGVCGIAHCTATAIRGIHTVRCAPDCHQRQPFCEEVGPWTSISPAINSLWSEWSVPECNNTCGKGLLTVASLCHDQVTCSGLKKCFCEVAYVDGVMKATRFTEPCVSTEGCTVRNSQETNLEGERDFDNVASLDDTSYNQGHVEPQGIPVDELSRSSRRKLLTRHFLADCETPSRNLSRVKRHHLAFRPRGIDGDADDDADDDDGDDEEDDSPPEEENEENGDQDEEEKAEDTVNSTEKAAEYYEYAIEGEDEVDEPGSEDLTSTTGSVSESCDDEDDSGSTATEALQYSDYDTTESSLTSGRRECGWTVITLTIVGLCFV